MLKYVAANRTQTPSTKSTHPWKYFRSTGYLLSSGCIKSTHTNIGLYVRRLIWSMCNIATGFQRCSWLIRNCNNFICFTRQLNIFVLFSEESAVLDLDGAGGKTFLRVLLHLGMHDYPPLVSGALRLLFRHFSQRQEVLQAFKQVEYWICPSLDLIFMFRLLKCPRIA